MSEKLDGERPELRSTPRMMEPARNIQESAPAALESELCSKDFACADRGFAAPKQRYDAADTQFIRTDMGPNALDQESFAPDIEFAGAGQHPKGVRIGPNDSDQRSADPNMASACVETGLVRTKRRAAPATMAPVAVKLESAQSEMGLAPPDMESVQAATGFARADTQSVETEMGPVPFDMESVGTEVGFVREKLDTAPEILGLMQTERGPMRLTMGSIRLTIGAIRRPMDPVQSVLGSVRCG